jgi:hypothetical protein
MFKSYDNAPCNSQRRKEFPIEQHPKSSEACSSRMRSPAAVYPRRDLQHSGHQAAVKVTLMFLDEARAHLAGHRVGNSYGRENVDGFYK